MNIVIDTSAVLAVILDEPEREGIIAATEGHSLVSPASVPWEVGNAFSAMFKRRRITLKEARKGAGIFEGIPVRYAVPALERSLQLAHDQGIYAYDAYVLECALRFGSPLLTLDRQLAGIARKLGLGVLEV